MSAQLVVEPGRPGWLAPSVLRQALVDGPAGADAVGLAVVGLLHAAGLLDCPEFAEWCIDVEVESGAVLWADVDLAALAACTAEGSPLDLTDGQCRVLSAAVVLVDLAAELRELPEPTRRLVVDALQAFVAGVGPAAADDEAERPAPVPPGGELR